MINAENSNLIKLQINELRKELDKLLENTEFVNFEKALELSRDIDLLINKYNEALNSEMNKLDKP